NVCSPWLELVNDGLWARGVAAVSTGEDPRSTHSSGAERARRGKASPARHLGMATLEQSRRLRALHSRAPLFTNWISRLRQFFPPSGTAPYRMGRPFQRSCCCSPSWRKPSRPCSCTSSTSGAVAGGSYREAEAWVLSDDVSRPCTFRNICDALVSIPTTCARA